MKALVLSSGGLDSTTALAQAVHLYGQDNVTTMSLSYGQKHKKELEAARAAADYYGVEHIDISIDRIFEGSDCALLEGSSVPIPETSYADQMETVGGGRPVVTYVPFRNGIFLSVAAGVAISRRLDIIYYGIHRDDAAGSAYPDCSKLFNESMATAIREGSGGLVRIEAPFVDMTKADIVRRGLDLGVPYELTWSCYEGGDKPCGRCATCRDRAKAFAANGVPDPALQ